MKKQLIILAVLFFAISISTAGLAVDNTGKFALGVETSYYNIAEQGMEGVQGVDLDFDATSLSGMNVTYYAADIFSVELGVDYMKANMDADNSFGFHLNGGVEIYPADNVAMELDLKYIWNSSDFDETAGGKTMRTTDVDLNAYVFGVGVKYLF